MKVNLKQSFFRKGYKLLLVPPALLIVLIVRILRPLLVIRFGAMPSSRIGNFASAPEIYLCKSDVGMDSKRVYDIFYCVEPISNYQLKKMWGRILHISYFPNLLSVAVRLNRFIPGYERHVLLLKIDPHLYRLYRGTPAHLFFTPEEEERGCKALKKIGIFGRPFVCFHVRDSAYLDSMYKSCNWRYHSYRDSSTHNYSAALRELVRRGYFAVRMGAIVKEALNDADPMIIDYATKYRTDFLDIYLSAKCQFFIGSGSGIDEITKIFRRPVAYVNFIPIGFFDVFNSLYFFIPKKLWLKEENRFLSFREILDSGTGRFCFSEEYEKAGIDVVDNTPEEITDLVIEMDERLKGAWQTSEEDEALQERFWSLFKLSALPAKNMCRIGSGFLRQNQQLIVG